MECQILKASTSKSMPWADVASMETEAIPTLDVGIASGKVHVIIFPLTIKLRVTGKGFTHLEEL
jgi:hypothetical protein